MTPEQERARIADVYSGLSNEELEEIAATGFELTGIAHQVLAAEIARRGLAVRIAATPPVDGRESDETVMLRKFRDLPDALLAKGRLESAGIQSYLEDDNVVRMDWFLSNAVGGIKLKVQAPDAEAANEILSHPGGGSDEEPQCPKCRSLDVRHRDVNKLLHFPTAADGIPAHKQSWTCLACGNEWEELSKQPGTERGAATLKELLPKDVLCPKCNSALSLNFRERRSGEFACQHCGMEFLIEE